jgi:hypothetical protein
MTNYAIAEGWSMKRKADDRQERRWTVGREVLVTWLLAVALLVVLVLLPNRGNVSLDPFAMLAPAAGGEDSSLHHDGDGPKYAGECSDRDYANELC